MGAIFEIGLYWITPKYEIKMSPFRTRRPDARLVTTRDRQPGLQAGTQQQQRAARDDIYITDIVGLSDDVMQIGCHGMQAWMMMVLFPELIAAQMTLTFENSQPPREKIERQTDGKNHIVHSNLIDSRQIYR